MRKIGNYYDHRNETFYKLKDGGWTCDNSAFIYKTSTDCINLINKLHDGSHKAEPKIIGYIDFSNYPDKTDYIYFNETKTHDTLKFYDYSLKENDYKHLGITIADQF
jgi:hypothetical protein